MRDGGAGLNDPIAIEVDAAQINNRPAKAEHVVSMTSAETGKAFRYQLVVHNAESSSWSPLARHVLAGIPSKPSGLVVHRYAETPYLTLTGTLNASAPPVAAQSIPASVSNTGTDVIVNFGSLDYWGAAVTEYRIQWR